MFRHCTMPFQRFLKAPMASVLMWVRASFTFWLCSTLPCWDPFPSLQDIDIKWVEYQNMIKYLSQWIKHNVAIMSDRSFPNSPVELKVLLLFCLCLWALFCTISNWKQQCCSAAAVVFILVAFVWQALYSQYLQFKDYDIPLKENEKTKIKNLYKMLEVYTHTHTHTQAFCCLCQITQRSDIESVVSHRCGSSSAVFSYPRDTIPMT